MGATKRLMQFIDYKGITKYKFCKDLGFSNKFLDNNRNIGTDKACKIIHYYKEINPEWLLTGEGSMLRESKEQIETNPATNTTETQLLQKENTFLKDNLQLLKETKMLLERDNNRLIIENNRLIKEKKELQKANEQLEKENIALKKSLQNTKMGDDLDCVS